MFHSGSIVYWVCMCISPLLLFYLVLRSTCITNLKVNKSRVLNLVLGVDYLSPPSFQVTRTSGSLWLCMWAKGTLRWWEFLMCNWPKGILGQQGLDERRLQTSLGNKQTMQFTPFLWHRLPSSFQNLICCQGWAVAPFLFFELVFRIGNQRKCAKVLSYWRKLTSSPLTHRNNSYHHKMSQRCAFWPRDCLQNSDILEGLLVESKTILLILTLEELE